MHTYSMRRAAWQAMRGFHDRGWRIAHSLDRIHESSPLEPRDRATANELAAICVRRRASLDAVLTAYIDRDRGKMENDLWLLAQLGLAQLLFRPDIPTHAAIHATAEVAKEVRANRWVGFLNGTLRKLSEAFARGEQLPSDEEAAAATIAGERPLGESAAVLTFDRPIVADPAAGKPEAKRYSLPRWLVRRWLERYGEEAAAVLHASNLSDGVWLRTKPGHREEVLQALAARDLAAETGPLADAVWCRQSPPLHSLGVFVDGRCSVQNLTAMQAVDLLDPQPGETILDLCAAPGGKTGMIAERLAGRGRVIAADSDERRLMRVAENITRLGVLDSVDLLTVGREGEDMPEAASVAAALVDVPCSNTGVLAKRPEARWRIGTEDLAELPPLQTALLTRAAATVQAGGRLVYSTCSIEPEENAEVVAAFLADAPNWTLVEQTEQRPSERQDGGFRALLRRA